MSIVPLALFLLLVDSAFSLCCARLGDTESRCIARYGGESDVQNNLGFDVIGDKAASFTLKTPQGLFELDVIFLNGVAVKEKITLADASKDIPEVEIKALLDFESTGGTWTEQGAHYRTDRSDNTSGSEGWTRSDGATAVCWMSGRPKTEHGWGEIDLSTREYAAEQGELDRRNGAR